MIGDLTEERYYVFRHGNWVGPYEIRDLRRCWAMGSLVVDDYIYIEPENQTVQAGSLFHVAAVKGPLLPKNATPGFNQVAGTYQLHSKRFRRKIRNAFFGFTWAVGCVGAILVYCGGDWLFPGYGLMLASILMALWGMFRIARLPGIALIIAMLAGGAVLTRMQMKTPGLAPQAELEGEKSSQVFLGPPPTQNNL